MVSPCLYQILSPKPPHCISTLPPACDWLMAELLTLPPPELELELELALELPEVPQLELPVPYMLSVKMEGKVLFNTCSLERV